MKIFLNLLPYVLFSITTVTLLGLTSEEKAQVLAYCKQLALEAGLPDAKFRFKDDLFGNGQEHANSNGFYQPYQNFFGLKIGGGYISLSPKTQKQILVDAQNFRRKKGADQSNYLSWATFVLLHELGHYESNLYRIIVHEHPSRLSSRRSIFLGRDLHFHVHSEERYADRFATRMLCKIFGHQEAQKSLKKFLEGCTTRGALSGERPYGLLGYQCFGKLLEYAQELEQKSTPESARVEKPLPASQKIEKSLFYLNYSI